MHFVLRLLHPSQVVSAGVANVHRIFRRLHSQQLCVPLRIFRRFLLGVAVASSSAAEVSFIGGRSDISGGVFDEKVKVEAELMD